MRPEEGEEESPVENFLEHIEAKLTGQEPEATGASFCDSPRTRLHPPSKVLKTCKTLCTVKTVEVFCASRPHNHGHRSYPIFTKAQLPCPLSSNMPLHQQGLQGL